jgi:hypothetical protein
MMSVNAILRNVMMMIQIWMIFSQQNHVSVWMIMKMPTFSLMNMSKVNTTKYGSIKVTNQAQQFDQ